MRHRRQGGLDCVGLQVETCCGLIRADAVHYSSEKKTIKWWKKLSFHLFDLLVVNHTSCITEQARKKMSLGIFHEKVVEGLLDSAALYMVILK
jgi:hypothetical protein